ncbi:MAG: nucleotidyltransferase domain-containing protein [Bacteroidetes bacterium]|nr:nucleotidyltransferase domain-containing protein [Bacteroidota bacterium]
MQEIITENIDQIRKLCRKHQVKKLWVFGSVLRDDFRAESDIDFLYEMDDKNIPEDNYYFAFWGFLEALRELLGRKIDLAWYSGIKNPYFKEEVDETKKILYDQERQEVSL